MHIETVKLSDLKHDQNNPRVHEEENMRAIRKSLEHWGQVEPLVVQASTMMVIGGNGRLDAMKELGWSECNVHLVDIDDDKAKALGIALNRTGELAKWNEDVLHSLIMELQDADMDLESTGYNPHEIEKIISAMTEAAIDMPDDSAEEVNDDTAMGRVASNHVRMVQLYFDENTISEFNQMMNSLSDVYGTDNTTDTVMEVVREAYRSKSKAA